MPKSLDKVCPMLIVIGEKDRLYFEHLVADVAERSGADLQIIPDAGHAFILEDAGKPALPLIESWIGKVV